MWKSLRMHRWVDERPTRPPLIHACHWYTSKEAICCWWQVWSAVNVTSCLACDGECSWQVWSAVNGYYTSAAAAVPAAEDTASKALVVSWLLTGHVTCLELQSRTATVVLGGHTCRMILLLSDEWWCWRCACVVWRTGLVISWWKWRSDVLGKCSASECSSVV